MYSHFQNWTKSYSIDANCGLDCDQHLNFHLSLYDGKSFSVNVDGASFEAEIRLQSSKDLYLHYVHLGEICWYSLRMQSD